MKRGAPIPVRLLWDPGHCLALGLGTGLAPRAPGTVGSLLGVALYWPMAALPTAGYMSMVAALFAVGVWLCGRTARRLGVADHSAIVWDEVVGVLVTLGWAAPSVLNGIVGFGLFRLFDIWKPGPIRWLDARVQGGLGIMVDDLAAGCLAGVGLALFEYLS